jgi:Zn finger protein HypA/HybF involved in hydrogenase expression
MEVKKMAIRKMSKAKAKVWCRECGEEMRQHPYDILAFTCKNCKLKAEVQYDVMNKVNLK